MTERAGRTELGETGTDGDEAARIEGAMFEADQEEAPQAPRYVADGQGDGPLVNQPHSPGLMVMDEHGRVGRIII